MIIDRSNSLEHRRIADTYHCVLFGEVETKSGCSIIHTGNGCVLPLSGYGDKAMLTGSVLVETNTNITGTLQFPSMVNITNNTTCNQLSANRGQYNNEPINYSDNQIVTYQYLDNKLRQTMYDAHTVERPSIFVEYTIQDNTIIFETPSANTLLYIINVEFDDSDHTCYCIFHQKDTYTYSRSLEARGKMTQNFEKWRDNPEAERVMEVLKIPTTLTVTGMKRFDEKDKYGCEIECVGFNPNNATILIIAQ